MRQKLGHRNLQPCRGASDLKSGAKVRYERTWTHWEEFGHDRVQRRNMVWVGQERGTVEHKVLKQAGEGGA